MSNEHPKLTRLKAAIKDKPVFFLAPGPSLAELESTIHLLPKDSIYIGHNIFLPCEKILHKINLRFDLVWITAPQVINLYGHVIKEFLEREGRYDGLFITSVGAEQYIERHIPGELKKHSHKIITVNCESGHETPPHAFKIDGVNSLAIFSFIFMTLTLIKANARFIGYFGLDGGWNADYDHWYYGEDSDYPGGLYEGNRGSGSATYTNELKYLNTNWDKLVEVAGLTNARTKIFRVGKRDNDITWHPRIEFKELIKELKNEYGKELICGDQSGDSY